jgi:predicted metal-dependent enzyme (double-stranded beta helix superfamily)
MFTTDGFIESCQMALRAGEDEKSVRELVAEAVTDPARVIAELPVPLHAGFEILHRAPDLTLLHFSWAPWMCFKPHNHCMWSVVGIFSGREDNIFWRPGPNGIEAAGARSLGATDVTVLGRDIIHSVVNPIGKLTRAIHVYGGDFFAPPVPRSEWDPETLIERPWDMDDTRRLFAEAESRAQNA